MTDEPAEPSRSAGEPADGPARLVVVGASAGGISALDRLLGALPGDLDAAVVVVLHLAPGVPSVLPRVLQRSTALHVLAGGDEAPLRPGHVYVAVPDHHLVVQDDGCLGLDGGLTENGFRPAVDRLFRTAAERYGPGVLGVVLSGSLDDGAAGARAVELGGGEVAVQDPGDAEYRSMPEAALEVVERPFVGTPERIAAWIVERLQGPVDAVAADPPPSHGLADDPPDDGDDPPGDAPRRPVTEGGRDPWVTCPDCHGALREVDDLGIPRYRCLIGHTWSPGSLLARQQDEVDRSAVAVLRYLAEQAELNRRLEQRSEERGRPRAAAAFAVRSRQAEQAIAAMQRVLGDARATLGEITI